MFPDFLSGFAHSAGIIAAYLLLAVVSLLGLKFFTKNKQDIAFAEIALNLVVSSLGAKLGPGASEIIKIWLQGLHAVSDGNLTTDQMTDKFMQYIKDSLKGNANLTDTDFAAIEKAAQDAINLLQTKKASTKQAVTMMIAKQ